MIIHKEKHKMAGRTIVIPVDLATNPPVLKGSEYEIEDWWDRLLNKSWMDCDNNIACMIYAIRSTLKGLPIDDEVVYGKVNGLGHLVHISELTERVNQ